MNLTIGLPINRDKEYTEFWDSFYLMQKIKHNYMRPSLEAPIHHTRNELVKKAFEAGSTHLIMMDTDQIYPEDTLMKMLAVIEKYNAKVVGTIVYRRYPPFDPLAFNIEKGGKLVKIEDKEIFSKEVIQVDVTGCGCILLNMEVFNIIKYPWFEDKSAEIVDFKSGKRGSGEDIGFCKKLHKLGYKIYIDTSVEIEHLSMLSVNKATYLIYKKLNQRKEK